MNIFPSWKPLHPATGLQNIFPARKLSVRRAVPLHPLSCARGRGRVDNGRDANDSPHRSLRIDLWKVPERAPTGLERRVPCHAGAARSTASAPRGGPIRGRILSRFGHSSRRRGHLIRRRACRRFAPLTRIRLHRRIARSRHIRSRRLAIAAAPAEPRAPSFRALARPPSHRTLSIHRSISFTPHRDLPRHHPSPAASRSPPRLAVASAAVRLEKLLENHSGRSRHAILRSARAHPHTRRSA